MTFVHLFESMGFVVQIALNGKIAWDLMQTTEFDLVLTDIKMPIMNGVELLKKIRTRDRVKPAVFVTSGYSDYPADVLFQLGANGFMAKPCGASSMRDVLTRGFLKREDLWKGSESLVATERIAKKFETAPNQTESGEILFGNGGFAIKQNSIPAKALSTVAFSFTFGKNDAFEKLEGLGTVQWVHLVDSPERKRGMGIEIRHLKNDCRDKFCKWISSQNFEAFIPIL